MQINDSQKSDVSFKSSREILNLFRSMEKNPIGLKGNTFFIYDFHRPA